MVIKDFQNWFFKLFSKFKPKRKNQISKIFKVGLFDIEFKFNIWFWFLRFGFCV